VLIVILKREIMDCEDCNACYINKKEDADRMMQLFRKTVKKENSLGVLLLVKQYLEINQSCITHNVIVIKRASIVIAENKSEMLVSVFSSLIKEQFTNMGSSNLGLSGSREMIEAVKEHLPELEKPLRDWLHEYAEGQ
jgi:hypothetical protein